MMAGRSGESCTLHSGSVPASWSTPCQSVIPDPRATPMWQHELNSVGGAAGPLTEPSDGESTGLEDKGASYKNDCPSRKPCALSISLTPAHMNPNQILLDQILRLRKLPIVQVHESLGRTDVRVAQQAHE